MSAATEAVARIAEPVKLSFGRTIERSLVHRASVAEVFVTDIQPAGDARFVAAAQLPLSHGYYSDHTRKPAVFDPLLLLEAGRQAGIAGAHLLGLPKGAMMMVAGFTIALTGALPAGDRPGELRIDNRFDASRMRGGRVRTGSVTQDLYLGEEHIGVHTMEVNVVTPSEHNALRGVMRGTPAPFTSQLEDLPARRPPPHVVGRTNPLNVVIADVFRDGQGARALVAPLFGNRSLFDHDYDHLPATTLAEAARQLAVVLAGPDAVPYEVSGRFMRFAELDAPCVAQAARSGPAVHVEFSQDDSVIAEFGLRLTWGSAA
jgi:2-oxo-3-(phosphooxy)propyl 3-oxoalkanoate synthase